MKLLKHIAIFLFLLSSAVISNAQCSIMADSVGCMDEPVRFNFTPSNATIVQWEFGDGATSTQKSPVHKFSSTGFFTVKVTVRLPDNSTCTDDHLINIHAPPNPGMIISEESDFCLSKNKLCLIDSTKNGLTNTKITKKIILWGDGASTSSSNPFIGEKKCYTYQRVDSFKVTVEWTNRVGCSALQEFDIKIKQDYIPSFILSSSSTNCDKSTLCFDNDSLNKPKDLLRYEWDFGFGPTDTPTWNASCFTYDTPGKYTVKFRTILKNGCVNEKKQQINVAIPEIVFNVTKGDKFKCYPAQFPFSQEDQPGLEYSWYLLDTSNHVLDSFGNSPFTNIVPPSPGRFHVLLKIRSGDCVESEIVDTITTAGVLADLTLFNGFQCKNQDTVIACNKTLKFGTDSVRYMWNFGDNDPDVQCTEDREKGIDLNKNCNWVIGENAKHKYSKDGCFKVRLIAWDLENGCVDSANGTVIISEPDSAGFYYSVERKCIGIDPEYRFVFEKPECVGGVLVNYDSACDKNRFLPWNTYHNYTSICDTSRWVTVGFAMFSGLPKIYRSCDTSDYYYDDSRVCRDTVWKSHWFRLSPPPDAKFDITIENCIPAKATATVRKPVQNNVAMMRWNWGDEHKDTVIIDSTISPLPKGVHYYEKAGNHIIRLYMETDSGCFDKQDINVTAGYFNTFSMDTVICPGQVIRISDFIRYWNDPRPFWRDTSRAKAGLETITWDFGAGKGFNTTGPLPRLSYDKEGRYRIRMATKDQYGCTDTAERWITVTGVVADIVNKDKELICSDIIQFFDSSWMPGNYDSIANWHWDFGDGKTPSYLQNPYHYYSSYGDFTLRLIVETYSGCIDTAFFPITIDGPEPYFDIESDTVGCVPFTAEFRNLSVGVSDFIWYFGDDQNTTLSTKQDTNVTFTYTKPGIYYIYLWGSDSVINEDNRNEIYYCKSIFPDTSAVNPAIRRIVVLPVPEVDFMVDSIVCTSNPVFLTDRSDSMYDIYRWYVSNGDSIISTNKVTPYQFPDSGTYTLWYRPFYIPEGPYERACYEEDSMVVKVYEQYVGLSFTKDEDCPVYTFSNESRNTQSLTWDFGAGAANRFEYGPTVTRNFSLDSGSHTICLYVTDQYGCKDTACEDLLIDYRFNVFVPNIFTPEGDLLNDDYDIDILNEGVYDLKVYNRWGELVYNQSVDDEFRSGLNWDGTYFNSGDPCPEGTYFYIFRFSNRCIGDEKKIEGTITLIR